MSWWNTFTTPSGFWNPLVWMLIFFILVLLSYLIWRRGESSYKKGSMQTDPFLSGYGPESKEALHVRAGNIYWGFASALKSYYSLLRKIHTGIVNDYVGWYIGILAMMLFIYFLWGGF
ncbi:MAG: hydrogenase [Thermoplasmata archaeon]|nr:hydrogenase [Thermoplasmata archaeon]